VDKVRINLRLFNIAFRNHSFSGVYEKISR